MKSIKDAKFDIDQFNTNIVFVTTPNLIYRTNSNGDTLLQVAVRRARMEGIILLLSRPGMEDSFALENKAGHTILTQMVFRGLLDVLNFFVDKYIDKPHLFNVDIKIKKQSNQTMKGLPLILYCLMLHTTTRFELFSALLKLKPNLTRSYLGKNLFSALLSSVAKWQRRYNDLEAPSVDFFKICIEVFRASGGNLLYLSADRNSILHECVQYKQPKLLIVALERILKDYGSKFFKKHIDAPGFLGFSPLLLCCRHNFDMFNGQCRVKCAEILIKYGANVNFKPETLPFTPLLFCLAYEEYNKSKGELACLLIENGADPKEKSLNGVCCVYYAILSHAVPVVKKMVEKGEVNFTAHLHNSRRFPIVLAADNYLVSRDGGENNLPGLELLKFFQDAGSPTTCALFSICFCLNHKYERKLLRELLDAGFNVKDDARNHLPLLFLATLFKDVTSVRMLLQSGANEKKTFKPSVCLNKPSHRWVGFETLKSYFEFHNTDPQRRKCRCHLCLRTLVNTETIIACSDGDSCDCRVCADCMMYVNNTTQGSDLIQFAERCHSYKAKNLIEFHSKTTVGKQLLTAKLGSYSSNFINAGLTNEAFEEVINEKVLIKLGIDSLEEHYKLLF